MASDYFLKIEGMPGESSDAKHKGEIEIESFSFGAHQTGTHAAGGGGGAGKVSMQDFHFTLPAGKCGPKLMLACATGEHLKKALLTVRKAGKEQQEYYKVTMEDLLVSSYQTGGSSHGSSVPQDQISLNFSKIKYGVAMQKADGTLEAPVEAGWDLKSNKQYGG
jgi:type VI secretion system secreted protein Hcp